MIPMLDVDGFTKQITAATNTVFYRTRVVIILTEAATWGIL